MESWTAQTPSITGDPKNVNWMKLPSVAHAGLGTLQDPDLGAYRLTAGPCVYKFMYI